MSTEEEKRSDNVFFEEADSPSDAWRKRDEIRSPRYNTKRVVTRKEPSKKIEISAALLEELISEWACVEIIEVTDPGLRMLQMHSFASQKRALPINELLDFFAEAEEVDFEKRKYYIEEITGLSLTAGSVFIPTEEEMLADIETQIFSTSDFKPLLDKWYKMCRLGVESQVGIEEDLDERAYTSGTISQED